MMRRVLFCLVLEQRCVGYLEDSLSVQGSQENQDLRLDWTSSLDDDFKYMLILRTHFPLDPDV
jgi:hypothetical protein